MMFSYRGGGMAREDGARWVGAFPIYIFFFY
jgi:hypothetical protein